jgi:glycosyltransferase involved in cell wall biosynthesis
VVQRRDTDRGAGQKVTFSFIIPTLNEEQHIAKTIRQFKQLQGICSYEVIIGDSRSTDKTVSIAKHLGARVCIDTSRKSTTGSGRNAGARLARGEILIFCDADTMLDDVVQFIGLVQDVFSDMHVVGAIPRLAVFPDQRIWKDRLFHAFFNSFLRLSFFLRAPYSFGQCQVVRAKDFFAVGMYDADRVHAEDSFLFKKLVKRGKLAFIKECTVLELPRRYRAKGYLNVIAEGVYSALGQAFLKKNVIEKPKRVN